MLVNGSAVNQTAVNATSGPPPEFYGLSLAIEQSIFETYPLALAIEQTISLVQYHLALAIEQTLNPVRYPLSLAIEQSIFATYPLSLAIEQSIYTSAAFAAGRWTARVMLAGVDVSARLTGQIEVDGEESAARVAEFTLVIDPGPFDLAAWTNAPVTIDYLLQDSAGAMLGQFRRFTGVVDVPDYDRSEGVIRFACTDNLQRVFEGRKRTYIAGVIGGTWSPFVFDADADSWTYAQDRLSTQAYAFDMDVYRQPVKTPWQAKATADFNFDEHQLLDSSLTFATPSARNLVNTVQFTLEYRFERLLQRQVGYNFAPPAYRYIDGMAAPTPGQIAQAIHSSGWALEGAPILSALPSPGNYTNSTGGDVVYLADCPRYTYAGGAAFALAKRWTQTVTETHVATVSAPVSVAAVGELWGYDHVSISAGDLDHRPDNWDKTEEHTLDVALYETTPDIGGACSSWVESHALNVVRYSTPTPAGMSTFAATGDKYLDLDDRAEDGRTAFQQAFAAAVAVAKTRILTSHRGARVKGAIMLNPLLDRVHTVRVATAKESAQGKVVRIRDLIDIESGSAVTEFEIAVSQPIGIGLVTPTPIDPPPKPPATQNHEDYNPAVYGDLRSYFVAGGDAEMTDTEQGWSPQLDEFRILTPAVDAANINHATVSAAYAYQVNIPADELTIEA